MVDHNQQDNTDNTSKITHLSDISVSCGFTEFCVKSTLFILISLSLCCSAKH